MVNFFKLVVSILLSLAAGFVGSYFTTSEITSWYKNLNKPFFNPPDYLFGPVWTILYILMGVSLFFIWRDQSSKNKKNKRMGINYFVFQLIFNAFWSIAFFGAHSPLFGLIIIVILWVLIFQTIKTFSKINKTAAYLLYPYIAWVSFATILNLVIFILNL